jgi:hypothetical protein
MRSTIAFWLPVLITFLFVPTHARAAEVSPFFTRDQSPFVQVYGLPPSEAARTTPRGSLLLRAAYNLANNSTSDWSHKENALIVYGVDPYWSPNIILDGEMSRFDLALRYGLTDRVELGVDLPYIAHGEGVMDNFIEWVHDLFNATGGATRAESHRDSLQYKYRRNADVLVNFTSPASGFGDVRLTGALSLYHKGAENSRDLALRLGLKLPTGESAELTGSGGTDLSVYLVGSDAITFSGNNLTFWGSTGLLFTGEGEVLEELRRDVVLFGSLGAGWSPLEWLSPKVQIDWHSAFYSNTNMKPLGEWSAQIVMGAEMALPRKFMLDLAIAEDLNVKTAPDVTFHLAMRRLF